MDNLGKNLPSIDFKPPTDPTRVVEIDSSAPSQSIYPDSTNVAVRSPVSAPPKPNMKA